MDSLIKRAAWLQEMPGQGLLAIKAALFAGYLLILSMAAEAANSLPCAVALCAAVQPAARFPGCRAVTWSDAQSPGVAFHGPHAGTAIAYM